VQESVCYWGVWVRTQVQESVCNWGVWVRTQVQESVCYWGESMLPTPLAIEATTHAHAPWHPACPLASGLARPAAALCGRSVPGRGCAPLKSCNSARVRGRLLLDCHGSNSVGGARSCEARHAPR
jgi:hypothetical protein